jgi:sarcosine oxidase
VRDDVAEYIVIGAGLLGLAAARSLHRRGHEVLVLEQASVGHPASGSRGEARIFRFGYEDIAYVEMAIAALDEWRALERESGRKLVVETGQLTFGDDGALAGALAGAGAPFELLTASEVGVRFPAVAPPGAAVFEPRSGVLLAGDCLAALRDANPDAVLEHRRATGIVDDGRRATVQTEQGPIEASVVICCAGPASAGLLAGAGVDVALEPTLEQVAYFARSDGGLPAAPVIIESREPAFSGLPTPTLGLYKAAHHHAGPVCAPELAADEPDAELIGRIVADACRLIPALDPEPVLTERCIYDNTADRDFVIDRVGRVVIGAGTSGHGFKFGALLGEVLADLATGAGPTVRLERFRADRPAAARAR